MTDRQEGELERAIKDEITRNGPIPVSRYMKRCLLDPAFGYYRRQAGIGRHGDFVTAPEISQVFGELIGIWVGVVWQQMGAPSRLRLIELGPGRGTMMRDMLRAIKVVPGLLDCLTVVLIEASDTMRVEQRITLKDAPVAIFWPDDFSTEANIPTIIVANEFFDALPVDQFVCVDGVWRARCVGLDGDGALKFDAGTRERTPENMGIQAPRASDGDIFESRWRSLVGDPDAFCKNLLSMVGSQPSALLAIDYGHEGPATGDTLQAVRNHRYVSPLDCPGEADLTAHVDFSELTRALATCGFHSDRLMSQAEFLGNLGIAERIQRLMRGKPASEANDIEMAAHRLISVPGMGNRFQVLLARTPDLTPLPPIGGGS